MYCFFIPRNFMKAFHGNFHRQKNHCATYIIDGPRGRRGGIFFKNGAKFRLTEHFGDLKLLTTMRNNWGPAFVKLAMHTDPDWNRLVQKYQILFLVWAQKFIIIFCYSNLGAPGSVTVSLIQSFEIYRTTFKNMIYYVVWNSRPVLSCYVTAKRRAWISNPVKNRVLESYSNFFFILGNFHW